MFDFLGVFYQYYYLVIALQAVCVFHSIRKGNQQKWIWIIVFLPFIGSLAYLFTEVIQRRHVSVVQNTVGSLVNPKGRIHELEKQFKFSDTFTNRVALADAYLENGRNQDAIALYEPTLSSTFSTNEHVIKQLIIAYYNTGRYEDVARIAPKVVNSMYFSKSRNNLLYALALEKINQPGLAEQQYKAMSHRFSNYEARYLYGDFLLRQNRKEDAALVFYDVVEESQHLKRSETGGEGAWINKAKSEWEKLMK